MKKFTFNVDLIIVVIVLFVICIGSNIFQRKLHNDLHKQNIELISTLTDTKLELINTIASLSKYEVINNN